MGVNDYVFRWPEKECPLLQAVGKVEKKPFAEAAATFVLGLGISDIGASPFSESFNRCEGQLKKKHCFVLTSLQHLITVHG